MNIIMKSGNISIGSVKGSAHKWDDHAFFAVKTAYNAMSVSKFAHSRFGILPPYPAA